MAFTTKEIREIKEVKGVNMSSNYTIHLTQSSYCPNCNNLVYLLCDKDGKERPSFYICWGCRFIAEIGKGSITEDVQISKVKGGE